MTKKITLSGGDLTLEDDIETTALELTQLRANDGKNILENPSFESYNIDTNLPDFWTLQLTPTLAIAADTLFPARQGNQLTITGVGANLEGIQLVGSATNWLKVLPNTEYSFSFDYKVTAGDNLIVFVEDFNDGAFIGNLVLLNGLSSVTAVRISSTFRTHVAATNLRIIFMATLDTDVCIISHLKLEQGAIATPYIYPDRDRMTVRTEITNSTPDPVIASRWNKHNITAQGDAPTISAPTGLVYDGDKLLFRFEDDGTGRAITWNAIYEAVEPLPATTTAGKKLYVDFDYNAADTKYDCVYSVEEP